MRTALLAGGLLLALAFAAAPADALSTWVSHIRVNVTTPTASCSLDAVVELVDHGPVEMRVSYVLSPSAVVTPFPPPCAGLPREIHPIDTFGEVAGDEVTQPPSGIVRVYEFSGAHRCTPGEQSTCTTKARLEFGGMIPRVSAYTHLLIEYANGWVRIQGINTSNTSAGGSI